MRVEGVLGYIKENKAKLTLSTLGLVGVGLVAVCGFVSRVSLWGYDKTQVFEAGVGDVGGRVDWTDLGTDQWDVWSSVGKGSADKNYAVILEMSRGGMDVKVGENLNFVSGSRVDLEFSANVDAYGIRGEMVKKVFGKYRLGAGWK